ncbi:MAG: SDR family NAD(P)-dependent oxidoreductase [Rickettsiales bacterium]|nr:SDR family NAD(P)-dependent oxidoreductase [Rickettsiales bacterium]
MFQSKRIWLIGASEGIGAALATQLSHEGAQLILSSRQQQRLLEVQQGLAGQGHQVAVMDVTSRESVRHAFQEVIQQGVPDIVIYNAGAYDPMSAQGMDLARAEQMIDVNFSGALRVLDSVLPAMLSRQQGHIVLVASVAGYRGLPKAIGYGASKAALLHLAENLYIDLETTGIKVQVVNPGFVKTRLTDKNDFKMPMMISPEQAASAMVAGMKTNRFDIHFPKRFTRVMKLLRLLPYPWYFWLVRTLL